MPFSSHCSCSSARCIHRIGGELYLTRLRFCQEITTRRWEGGKGGKVIQEEGVPVTDHGIDMSFTFVLSFPFHTGLALSLSGAHEHWPELWEPVTAIELILLTNPSMHRVHVHFCFSYSPNSLPLRTRHFLYNARVRTLLLIWLNGYIKNIWLHLS